MNRFKADLHVHTVLSPCAQVEMIPPLIIRSALENGINLIAITDHNASANIAAVQTASLETGVTVLPGIEVQTREEVHLLCLFDTLDQIMAFQHVVDKALPNRINDPEHFGEQYVVDESGEFIHCEDRLLLTSTSLSLEQAIDHAHRFGGLAIPAHIDRQAFGLISMLGFIPSDLDADAFEITRHLRPQTAREKYPLLAQRPLLIGGDAHYPSELLGSVEFVINSASIGEIKQALQHRNGREYFLKEMHTHPIQY